MAKKKVAAKKKAPPSPIWSKMSKDRDHSLVVEFAGPVEAKVFLGGSEILPKVDGDFLFIKCNPGLLEIFADAAPVSVHPWVP